MKLTRQRIKGRRPIRPTNKDRRGMISPVGREGSSHPEGVRRAAVLPEAVDRNNSKASSNSRRAVRYSLRQAQFLPGIPRRSSGAVSARST